MRDPEIVVSMAPHAHSGRTVPRFMVARTLSLLPAAGFGVYQFGVGAAFTLSAAVLGALLTEGALDVVSKRRPQALDGHAALQGLLLGMMLSPVAPWWVALIGGVAAVLIGKAPFGPLGGAPLSPAIVGLLVLAISFPQDLRQYAPPRTADSALRAQDAAAPEMPVDSVLIDPSDAQEISTLHAFLGDQVGAIGAISPLLLLLGFLLVLWLRAGTWQGPLGYFLGMGMAAQLGHVLLPDSLPGAAFHLTTGMSALCGLYLVTEPICTPVVPRGLFVFGVVAGALAVVLRASALPYAPEAWALAIAMLATPLFDRIRPRPFGKVATHA
jgi:electron transport complex protein RnfD